MTLIPRSRFRGPRLLLLAGLIVLAAAVAQCRMVTDSLTGPRDSGAEMAKKGGGCMQECAHAARDAMKAEHDLHKENQKACDKNKECKQAEKERHQAAIEAIEEQRRQCQEGCHHQGGGRGGR